MIEYITGKLIKKETDNIIVDVHGLGYKINISLNTYDNLPNIHEDISLDTYFSVSENSQDLYGFHDILEKDLFQMLISVSGIGPKTALELIKQFGDIEELFKESDYVTLHLPRTPETENLVDIDLLRKMKPTARLVNCARGGIINENDLAQALEENVIQGAAIDVYAKEPLAENSPLRISNNSSGDTCRKAKLSNTSYHFKH